MPCSSSSAANLAPPSQPPASYIQTSNPGIRSVNNFSHHQQVFQQQQQQLQPNGLPDYYYGSQSFEFASIHPAFAITPGMNQQQQQQQQFFIPSTTPPESLPVPSLVYTEMSQHHLQQQLQPPIQYQVSAPTSPVSTKSFGGTTPTVGSASVKRPHPADSNASNDQKLPDQRSPQHTRTPSRKRGDSNVSIKSRRKRGDSNASSISSQSPRYPASGVSITSNSNEARSSSYTKKAAAELGIAKLNLVGNCVSSAGSGSASAAISTQPILSPQRRKTTNLINFSITNGRAVVSSTEDAHSVVGSRESSPISSPENDDDDDDKCVATTSRNRADDAIIALKEVIARVKLPFGLDKKQFTRSRANSVPVPVAARVTAPSGAGAMSAVTLATTPVGPPRKKTVDPTPPPHKKRVCSSAVSSPPRPPVSPSYMQSPHTNLNSPASISAPASAMGASCSPFFEIENSPQVFVDKFNHSVVQNQALPLPLQSSRPPQHLHQHQPIPQQQLQLLPRQHVSSQQLTPGNEGMQYHHQPHQQEQHLQDNFQLQLRQHQYLHQQMLDQQLAFQQQQQQQPFLFQTPTDHPPSSIISHTAYPQSYPALLSLQQIPQQSQQQQSHIIMNEEAACAYYSTSNTNFSASPPLIVTDSSSPPILPLQPHHQQPQQTIAFPVYGTPAPGSMDNVGQYFSPVYHHPQQLIPIDSQQQLQQRQQHLQ
ncbi:hypothetical protein D0Z00_001976 [Geotrichum galactomycetum]|uniref:Uncharacterized protein n=1 Tax=Geotrichum galactomycetum TaxID=27317 RepID=A0ACB6V5H2_9ASCO|nr:hypothetical protein D0Z00_001976 [Geotrichum candidum]